MNSNDPSRKYYKELFVMRSMLIKLFTFLLNEEKCHAAGYEYYYHHLYGSGPFCHDVIMIGYEHPEKENIRVDVTYDENDNPLYWLYITCKGERPLKYIRYIINTFCRGKETFEMNTILKLYSSLVKIVSMRIISKSIIKHESDDFMLKVLENMRMRPEETRMFPMVDMDCILGLNTFTLDNLYMTNKIFDAIIEGITHNI